MFETWTPTEIWAFVSLTLWLAEVFVPGMILGCLGTGAVGGLIAAAFGGSIEAQLIAASVASILAFFFLRPLALNRWFKGADVSTGVEALVGRTATVTQPFDGHSLLGRCKVDGDDWLAKWTGPAHLLPKTGETVRIQGTDSNTLIVHSENLTQ